MSTPRAVARAFPGAADRVYGPAVDVFAALTAVLEPRADVRLAYVFGSLASGCASARSDADVAVLFAPAPPPRALDELTEDLEAAAGRRVDLVDLGVAPPVLAHEIVATGRCIVCRDATERGEFEARTVLRYLDTAHLRRIQAMYLRQRAERSR